MKDNKFVLSIVGIGGMGNWHRELINEEKIDGLIVKGAFDIKSERLDFAKSKGLVAYNSLDELLNDDEVDIVLCATPNDVHKEIVIKALNAKKNVVCEKPVCMNMEELQEMIYTANKNKKLFTVHQNRRWDADFLTIKKIFDEKMLGEVFNVECRVHGSRGIPGDWRGEKEHGGGMILDWGVHIIDQVLMMYQQKVKSLFCTLTNVTNEIVDDGFKLFLTFKDSKTALLEVGTSNFIELPKWYLQGVNGTAIIDDWYLNGRIKCITNWDKNDAVPIKTAAGLTKTM
ncbi:MAG: Gfo/Idh/MocA family oxidoreductase, partial [Oscillospiraceae bacterium]